MQVYYSRGLLKRPAVLGAVSVKMTELVTQATHIGCYSLMDGRKAVGGLLELRFRHRTPLKVSNGYWWKIILIAQ